MQSDMGNEGARKMGMAEASIPLEVCAAAIVRLLDTATRDTHGGKFWSADGDKEEPW